MNTRKNALSPGATIRMLRGARTQKEVAEAAGIPASTWSKIERGQQNPREKTFARIAGGLGLTPEELERRHYERLAREHGTLSDGGDGGAVAAFDAKALPASTAQRLRNLLATIDITQNNLQNLELEVHSLGRELEGSRLAS